MTTGLPNWFQNDAETNFKSTVLPAFSRGTYKFLQIGAYTGDASLWLYQNILKDTDSVLVDVDTWEGSEEVAHYSMNWDSVEAVYDAKTSEARQKRKIIKFKGTSDWFFKNNVEKYDFVYVDGDHTAYGVLKDAVSAYECLNVGGIIAFDDYKWIGSKDPADRPEMAIKAFLEIYRKRVEVVISEYQLWVKKIG